ncbi:hypothetical protein ACI1US_00623 [Leucobacter sp. BZR 635]
MTTRVRLNEGVLASIAGGLLEAGTGLRARRLGQPTSFPTVSGAGNEVDSFLASMSVARSVLADAAHSASLAAAALLSESSELDAAITRAMPGGFLLSAGEQ